MADTLRVLYVDDEPDLLEIGKLFLHEFRLNKKCDPLKLDKIYIG
jgi:hypothetical protein